MSLPIETDVNVNKEILALARHHKQILKRRFPCFNYLEGYMDDCVHIDVETRDALRSTILVVIFSLSSIQISIRPFDDRDIVLDVNYADPKFTDEIVYDVLIGMGIGNLSRLKT